MSLLLDIVTTAAILYVVALGLLIVFGVMGIISFAHGAMLTVGGYAALLVTQGGLEPVAQPAGGGAGWACWPGRRWSGRVLRPLYRRPLDAILATWGLGIVIGQVITLVFGRQVQFARKPAVRRCCHTRHDLLASIGCCWLCVAVAAGPGAIALVLQRHAARPRHPRRHRQRELGAVARRQQRAGAVRELSASARPLPRWPARWWCRCRASIPNMGVPWLVGAFMLVLLSGSSLVSMAAAALGARGGAGAGLDLS